MRLQDSQLVSVQVGQNLFKKKLKGFGVVYSIVLDETHPLISNKNIKDASLIGSVEFRYTGKLVNNDEILPIALPFDKNIKTLPVRNETIEIYEGPKGDLYYRRLGIESSPYSNSIPTLISSLFSPSNEGEPNSNNYFNVARTGISKSSTSDLDKYNGFGKYFVQQEGIHKLKLYEGDTLIESRFGQSIRFSGYNNSTNEFSPTIIIRNSESEEFKQNEDIISVEENVNKDGSVIVMGSGQYELPFLPGTVNESNTSDFETRPDSFANYPTELRGNQILINSGRIIVSSKSGEMIFYSKGNYGFISDGALSIDNKLGIEVSVGGNINVVTNDRDILLQTGDGTIFLGNKELEPVVKGNQLVDILSELIDAIANMSFGTAVGPTVGPNAGLGPINLPQFGVIKRKLGNINSSRVQTS